MNIYEKFNNNFEDVRKFDWKEEWEILIGIEKPIDFTKKLVNVDNLEKYIPAKHLTNNFTGFVSLSKDKILINGSEEMVEYMYLEKGKIKYFQCHEGGENLYSKKFKFYSDNFCLHKGYSSNNQGKLTYIHRDSRFKLNNFNIEYFRFCKEKASIYLAKNHESFFSFDVDEFVADNLRRYFFKL